MSDEKITLNYKYSNACNDLQKLVACYLSKSPYLIQRKLNVLKENSLEIDFEVEKNLQRQGLCIIVLTPKLDFAGINPSKTNTYDTTFEIDVVENTMVWRAWLRKNNLQSGTGLDLANYVSEFLTNYYSLTFGKFSVVSIEQGAEDAFVISKITFKALIANNITGIISCDENCCIDYDFALQKDLEELSGKVISNDVDINFLSGKIDTNIENILSNTTDINDLSGKVISNDNDITNLSEKIDTNIENINKNKTDINDLSGKVISNDNDITFLSGKIDINKDNILFNTTDITNLKNISQKFVYRYANNAIINNELILKANYCNVLENFNQSLKIKFPEYDSDFTKPYVRDCTLFIKNLQNSLEFEKDSNFIYVDDEQTFTFENNKNYLITFSEVAEKNYYISKKELLLDYFPPSFTKFKVKVPANTADARSIKQITPFVNETVTIDWGDNSENTKVTTDSIDIPHNFPNINEEKTYIVKISDNAQRISISNQLINEFSNKIKIVEAISWGDRVEDVNSCYSFCFLTGNIPEWGANITNTFRCYMNCNTLSGNIPKWNSTITNAEGCYYLCSGLTGNIPKWNSTITNAAGCYSNCKTLTGNIPEWGANITDASNCYFKCSQLKGNIPEWTETITNAKSCYSNCSGLSGNIPKWNSTITDANNCYFYCSNLTGIWDPNAPIEEVCPERIKAHDGCVAGCSEAVTKHFLTTWGGNK